MRKTTSLAIAAALAGGLVWGADRAHATETAPKLLTWSEQVKVREAWLEKRHAMLLDMMRRHDIDMWIVVNEEFNDDPVTQFVAPPRPYAGNRDYFVFIDAGEKGLRRVAITGFAEERLRQFFESPVEPRPATQVLPELVKEHAPARSRSTSRRGAASSAASRTTRTYLLLDILGKDIEPRFVSSADLLEEYLDTRLPDEMPHYQVAVQLTEHIARRALSNEVITPGTTRVGDVRNWLYDELGRQGRADVVPARPARAAEGHAEQDVARLPARRRRGTS